MLWSFIPAFFAKSCYWLSLVQFYPSLFTTTGTGLPYIPAKVVVPDDQLSLAIGRKGQNVRLAAKLTGWNIDIRSQSEAEADAKEKIARSIFKPAPVTDLEGVGSKTAGKLQEAGFLSVEDIANADVEHLAEIPGIGMKTAEKLHSAAMGKIKEAEDDEG